tara:strand:+ start:1498 stop:1818 length:321 start_codon:yes stop_codon:yes gene_type:complete
MFKSKSERNVSSSTKEEVLERAGGKCQYCRKRLRSGNWRCDHIEELQYGGSNDIDNLQALCISCHDGKTGDNRKGSHLNDYHALRRGVSETKEDFSQIKKKLKKLR